MGGIGDVQALEPRLLFATVSHTTLSFPGSSSRGAAAVVGDTAIFAGGPRFSAESSSVLFYDAPKHRWSSSQLPRARGSIAATAVGNQALFAGGSVDHGQIVTDAVDVYNARTHRWSTAKLSAPRLNVAATTVGRLALFAGGVTPLRKPPSSGLQSSSDVVDIYDAKYGRWTTAHLSSPRECVATSVGRFALFDTAADSLLAATATSAASTVDIYDAKHNTWTTAQLPGMAIAAASVGHFALFVEGADPGKVDVFNAETGAWSTETLDDDDSGVAVASVGGNALIPGFNGTMTVFDAATAQWSTFQTGVTHRQFDTAFTLGRTAYFAGGFTNRLDDVHMTNSIEAYTLK